MEQIIYYASSEIYQKEKNDVYFIFCYTGSADIKNRVSLILANNPNLQLINNIFILKPNYHLSFNNSYEFFSIIFNSLKTKSKKPQDIINLILKKELVLPLK